jgi:hypothetical protein
VCIKKTYIKAKINLCDPLSKARYCSRFFCKFFLDQKIARKKKKDWFSFQQKQNDKKKVYKTNISVEPTSYNVTLNREAQIYICSLQKKKHSKHYILTKDRYLHKKQVSAGVQTSWFWIC